MDISKFLQKNFGKYKQTIDILNIITNKYLLYKWFSLKYNVTNLKKTGEDVVLRKS